MKKYTLLQSFFLCLALAFLYACQYNDLSRGNGTDTSPGVLVKVEVKIAVGGILYENLDAHINIKGYNAANSVQWVKDYDVTGPADTLAIQNGFDHYSIELVDKWGIHDIQANIPQKDIWGGRADGALPVTYVLGGSRDAKKLSSYVTSKEVRVEGAGIIYQPESRVLYTYRSDGLLEYIHHQGFNPQTSQFEESSTEAFTYDGVKVSKIITNQNGQPYSEDHFEYGAESKVTETLHFDNDLVWTQTSRHNYDSSNVNVNYSLSNGNSFSYQYNVLYKNIVSDKTTQTDQICNQGSYTYDKNINPFRHLGYMDFYLRNWSVNNKLTDHVDYIGCGYPTLIPLFHYFTYDQDGYPVQEITTYKSGSAQNAAYHEKLEFWYE